MPHGLSSSEPDSLVWLLTELSLFINKMGRRRKFNHLEESPFLLTPSPPKKNQISEGITQRIQESMGTGLWAAEQVKQRSVPQSCRPWRTGLLALVPRLWYESWELPITSYAGNHSRTLVPAVHTLVHFSRKEQTTLSLRTNTQKQTSSKEISLI